MYVVYRVTNKTNGKYYIGVHKADVEDSYLGSGSAIKAAISKYGKECFVREILFAFDTAEDAYAKEAELVGSEEVKNERSYNLKEGGKGGWDHISRETREKNYASMHEVVCERYGVSCVNDIPSVKEERIRAMERSNPMYAESAKEKISNAMSSYRVGKKHSDTTKRKIRTTLCSTYIISDSYGYLDVVHDLPEWCEGRGFKYQTVINLVGKGTVTMIERYRSAERESSLKVNE